VVPQPSENPNALMKKETGTGVGTMSKNLSKEREYERIFN
jgi:hypothetical protein